jgi:myo-inositol 2-dehydrogenase/D-chiro-inositol 1-dehydrogenase
VSIRVGIIGTGIMGADHARLLGGVVSGATLAAVFDVDRERARAVADTVGTAARVLDDPGDLITDGGVDAILVASSDPTHEEYVLASVAVGKPVLCEKPLAPTVDGCERILAAEQACGSRLVSVGFMRRYDPGYAELKVALDSGLVGPALMLHCVHRNPSSPPGQPSSRLITSSAVHEIDVARWLLGEEIVAVTVHKPRRSRGAGTTQDPQFIVLETRGGVLVDVEIYVNARYGYDVRCELVGEEGTVTLEAPATVSVRRDLSTGVALPADWRPRFAEAYRRELQSWIDGLRFAKASSGASAWDGYAATVVAETATRALGSGTREEVRLTPRPAFYA